MPAPATKAPSKKAFHFPKTAETDCCRADSKQTQDDAKAAVEAATKSQGKAAQASV